MGGCFDLRAGVRGADPEEMLPGSHLLVVDVPQGEQRAAQAVPCPQAGPEVAARPLAGCHHDHLNVVLSGFAACGQALPSLVSRRDESGVCSVWSPDGEPRRPAPAGTGARLDARVVQA